ncbi:hypothetical protein GUITHDRAFT_146292 [Guillardia theta CCMP2712]|uniref:Uncharacterized protein n=1 Tax=Guillardia theta (strain CCMP2712) TaxID=905079 RepID=L1IHL3_GUITC|nr:hypothetical protein GUITHDRAFT_146292 [Guillardia theta CCMP2712]EKX35733.1 hypothetical protein GUITHDRAFT_146292 [Guillardia theta CCMP2712]|eukprot:XP_005822713.1 hypothetical protein GUITHDRAFT_146292 [Guillardia theta CCMP2712]
MFYESPFLATGMSDSTNSATERPKRDAAKKFLNGDAAVKTEPKKPDASPSSSRPARKGTKDTKENKDSKDGGTSKRTAEKSSSGASSSNNAGEAEKKKRMQENLPKITVDKGIRRLDVAALKKVMEPRGVCACDGAGDVQKTLRAQDWTYEQQQRRLAGCGHPPFCQLETRGWKD